MPERNEKERLFTKTLIPETPSPFMVKKLFNEVPQVTDKAITTINEKLKDIGVVIIQRASDVINSPRRLERDLSFDGSIIVNTGGIDNLVNATLVGNQKFSTLDVAKALREAGIISSEDKYLKFGTAGTVIDDDRPAEVIDAQVIVKKYDYYLARAAARQDGSISLKHLGDPQRVLLENEFLVKEIGKEKNDNSLYIRINVGDKPQDILSLVYEAATAAGLEHYTIRGTVYGLIKADLAVITKLPDQSLSENGMDDIASILAVSQYETNNSNGEFHFVGTTSNAVSRQSEKWGKKTGNEIYSPQGHWYGYSNEGIGGHIRNLTPQTGVVVEIILEPAKVVQLVKSLN